MIDRLRGMIVVPWPSGWLRPFGCRLGGAGCRRADHGWRPGTSWGGRSGRTWSFPEKICCTMINDKHSTFQLMSTKASNQPDWGQCNNFCLTVTYLVRLEHLVEARDYVKRWFRICSRFIFHQVLEELPDLLIGCGFFDECKYKGFINIDVFSGLPNTCKISFSIFSVALFRSSSVLNWSVLWSMDFT